MGCIAGTGRQTSPFQFKVRQHIGGSAGVCVCAVDVVRPKESDDHGMVTPPAGKRKEKGRQHRPESSVVVCPNDSNKITQHNKHSSLMLLLVTGVPRLPCCQELDAGEIGEKKLAVPTGLCWWPCCFSCRRRRARPVTHLGAW